TGRAERFDADRELVALDELVGAHRAGDPEVVEVHPVQLPHNPRLVSRGHGHGRVRLIAVEYRDRRGQTAPEGTVAADPDLHRDDLAGLDEILPTGPERREDRAVAHRDR